jgi:hypothetical protein
LHPVAHVGIVRVPLLRGPARRFVSALKSKYKVSSADVLRGRERNISDR